MNRTISNTDNVIDSRDVIRRIAELESERDAYADNPPEDWVECGSCSGHHRPDYTGDCRNDVERWPADKCVAALWAAANEDDAAELEVLQALADEASSSADWPYGETLIRDSYFVSYAMELADDIGAVNRDAGWPNSFIDWDAAAEALQQDYMQVDFDGVTYWIRA